MSRGRSETPTIWRTLLLRGALPTAFMALAFAGCIKRECVCPGAAGESALGGAPLPRGVALVGPQGTLEFVLQGDDAASKVSLAPVPAQGQPFQQALRA